MATFYLSGFYRITQARIRIIQNHDRNHHKNARGTLDSHEWLSPGQLTAQGFFLYILNIASQNHEAELSISTFSTDILSFFEGGYRYLHFKIFV